MRIDFEIDIDYNYIQIIKKLYKEISEQNVKMFYVISVVNENMNLCMSIKIKSKECDSVNICEIAGDANHLFSSLALFRTYNKTACLPHRKSHDHYDSVCEMDVSLVYNIAEQLFYVLTAKLT